ncbi:MAG: hypothetical protein VKI82_09025 [Leptolyngbya sp.]|nr:hypothetical protein [Leptolyngbya sp.]
MDSPWLSAVLMMAAYITYGGFLLHISASPVVWGLSLGFAVIFPALCTIAWKTCRRFIILGFQSDLGYVVMALSFASLAVAAVTQFRMFSYLSLLVAVTLLTRVDMLIARFSNPKTWLCMVLLALLGLGLGWALHHLGVAHFPVER